MQTVQLNLTPSGVPPVTHASQYDTGRKLVFEIYEGSATVSIPSSAVVTVQGTKPDNKSFSYDSKSQPEQVSFSGDTVTVTTTQQMTAIAGTTPCEIKIVDNGTSLGTLNFYLEVEKNTYPDDDLESHSDLQAYQTAINATEHYATAAYNSAQDAASSASEADKAYQKTVSAYNDTVEEHNNAVKEITQLTSDSKTALNKIVSDGKTDIQTLIDNFNKGTAYTESVTLSASSWGGDSAPYTYALGDYAEKVADVMLDTSKLTEDQYEAAASAKIQGSNESALYAYGVKPDIDIPVLVVYRKGGE